MQIVDSIHKPKYHISKLVKYSHCNCLRAPAFEVASIEDTRNLHGTVKKLGDGHTLTMASSHLHSQSPGDGDESSTLHLGSGCCHVCKSHIYHPIVPWINGDGSMNGTVYEGLSRRIIGYVMQYPGISEVCLYYIYLDLLVL